MIKSAIYSYSAGLFDGEGYLGILKYQSRGKIAYTCTAEISNTNKEIVGWLLQTHGGIVNQVKRRNFHHSNERMQWRWILRRRNGLRTFLRYIEFYAIIKRDQIKLARSFMSREIEPEIAYRQMKELNHRGRKYVS